MSAEEIARRMRPITEEKAKESYEDLKELPCAKKPNLQRQGNKAIDYFFFKHRLAAKTKKDKSFLNALKSKKNRAYLLQKTRKVRKWDQLVKKKSRDAQLANMYSTFQMYYGTVNIMRPSFVKYIYCLLKPKVGILDPTMGWGPRCLAAMSMGIPYIGVDTNKNLESAYKKMIKTLEPDADVTLVFKPAETVDFSKYEYDLIFTSPPYGMLEKYEQMPEYGSFQGFLDKFFVPVVMNSWAGLKKGGHMAWNIPDEMYDAIKKMLPKVTKKIKMPLMDRHAGEAVKGEDLKKGATKRFEYVYVWKK
jgi:hypothetical protein